MEQKKVTVPDILRMKVAGERITMVTAYDCPFARLLDEAGVDILLVGDSLGMVVQGQDTTLPVTLDEMVYHTRMVARGRRRALVLGDLPFGPSPASPRPPGARSRPSASARARTATVRCSSCMTSSASRPTGRPASPSATRSSAARWCARRASTWRR